MANAEYAEMIEMPVSTCEMVAVPEKKRSALKDKLLIRRVNKNAEKELKQKSPQKADENVPKNTLTSETEIVEIAPSEKKEKAKKQTSKPAKTAVSNAVDDDAKAISIAAAKEKTDEKARKFRFNVVGAEVAAIFVLAVAIILTNVFWEDSGINTMIKSVFGTGEAAAVLDTRKAEEFTVFAPASGEILTLDNGVMTFSEKAAVYPPENGKVASVEIKDGKYTLTIAHTDVFKTVISGADAAYVSVGDSVYKNVPAAYAKAGTTVAMYNGGDIVTDYILDNDNVIWQS
ncbi:MAG: hypothetical protein J5762_07750 [Clostridia bacterium]|nr:hypothetical protein [Clostridia bacterium]